MPRPHSQQCNHPSGSGCSFGTVGQGSLCYELNSGSSAAIPITADRKGPSCLREAEAEAEERGRGRRVASRLIEPRALSCLGSWELGRIPDRALTLRCAGFCETSGGYDKVLPACLPACASSHGRHTCHAAGIRNPDTDRVAACHGPWHTSETNRAAAAGGRQSSVTCMHALVVDTPIRFLPWALAQPQGRRARPLPGAGRATARVRATGKRTSRDGDVCTDAGSERPAGDAGGSLIAPFVRRPAHVKSIESPPTPPPPPALVVALFPFRCSRRPVASLPIITAPPPPHAKRPNATPFFGRRERERQRSPSSPTPACLLPGCLARPQLPSHFTRSRSRVVARPACAKCYRYLYRLASRRVASAVTRPAGPRRRPRSWPGTKTDLLLPVLRLV